MAQELLAKIAGMPVRGKTFSSPSWKTNRLSSQGALQSESEASSALLGEMHAQQAEFSHARSQEFEALQAQLVSLNRDLAKQLELIDAKVEEADTLKEKLEASQLELERFSAEYCI
ncbi:hypothetical protein HPB47_003793 [Ixodes persulcatus]|uniref:Uncharacterized protein n=1 Tax=Ixodes persulcatus TaxID=34615 RepID=A0AC60PHZ6_IXOPE|nr:hypothetical protein HPB47_003793 [Ixodes persulcatus]